MAQFRPGCDFKSLAVWVRMTIWSRTAERGVSNGGVSRSGLVLRFLSFLGLSRFFRDFPDLLGNGGDFPICPFPLSRAIKSTYEEQSRKGPRHNLDLSRKKWETPPVWRPPGLASLNLEHLGCNDTSIEHVRSIPVGRCMSGRFSDSNADIYVRPLPPLYHAPQKRYLPEKKGEAFLLTVGAFLLTVKLLCLQSLKALIRRTFPL